MKNLRGLVWVALVSAGAAGAIPPAPTPIPDYVPTATRAATEAAPASAPATTAAATQTAEEAALVAYLKRGALVATGVRVDGNKGVATCSTTTVNLARFLQAAEKSDEAIQLAGMTVTTPTPGKDDLEVELRLTLGAPAKDGAPLLECMRDVTATFPGGGHTIWVTQMEIDAKPGAGTISGESVQEGFIKSVVNAMIAMPNFTALTWKEAYRGTEGVWQYQISFEYKPEAK